jgi:hypothetical protein
MLSLCMRQAPHPLAPSPEGRGESAHGFGEPQLLSPSPPGRGVWGEGSGEENNPPPESAKELQA